VSQFIRLFLLLVIRILYYYIIVRNTCIQFIVTYHFLIKSNLIEIEVICNDNSNYVPLPPFSWPSFTSYIRLILLDFVSNFRTVSEQQTILGIPLHIVTSDLHNRNVILHGICFIKKNQILNIVYYKGKL